MVLAREEKHWLPGWENKEKPTVALIEMSDKMYGGSCINVACIPTKSLKNAEEKLPYEKAFCRKNNLTSFLRKLNYNNIEKLSSAIVITGQAYFISPTE